jgi:hypothetical protein
MAATQPLDLLPRTDILFQKRYNNVKLPHFSRKPISRSLKGPECFEKPQHERKILNHIKTPPFVTSINSVQALGAVEGLPQSFSVAC